MHRLWTSGKKAESSSSSQSLRSDKEVAALNEAMAAALHVMNDDLESAEAGLKNGDSSYHKLGVGLITFLRAALGFEKEEMKEAQERLWAADAQASADQKRSQKDSGSFKSAIYEPGAEYVLTSAECLLMGAVVGIISERVTEALKGFYNMRKAYMALSSISDAETAYLEKQKSSSASQSIASTGPNSEAASLKNGIDSSKASSGPANEGEEADTEEDIFTDAAENTEDLATPKEYLGKPDIDGVTKDLSLPSVKNEKQVGSQAESVFEEDPDLDVFTHPIDAYIHSGTNLCFGAMLLILSTIPPAFGRILSIIGFRGDRERGLKMLWKASRFNNINGAMAGLALLAWYNDVMAFCDILPEANPDAPPNAPENIAGRPIQRLEKLLAKMRHNFPNSSLWKLEEARMLATQRRLDESIILLKQDFESPLKQVTALAVFQRSVRSLSSHSYQLCADSYIECTKLNQWSHALYFYLAGTAHVEMYRQALTTSDEATAKTEAKKATDCFAEVGVHAGKRRYMARQMPFEAFIQRKIAKWEAQAKEWEVPMIDAIGVSPLEEMIYFWNGYKTMTDAMLQDSLKALSWTDDASRCPNWDKCGVDEKCVLAILRAATRRSLRDFDTARNLLREEVLDKDKSLFKGGNRDDYPPAVAHYEMATILWQERSHKNQPEEGNAENVARIKEAQEWLDKARNWESFVLDARIGLKIATGVDTLNRWLTDHGHQTAM